MQQHQRGFTLIEVLVAVVIIAVMITTATLGFGRGDSQRFVGQAEQMQIWLDNILNEAILSSNTWGVAVDQNQLIPLVWDTSGWLKAADIEAFIVNEPLQLAHIRATEAKALRLTPDYIVLPTGQIMPPSTLALSSAEHRVKINWPDTGKIALEYVQ